MKRIFVILLTALLCLGITACSGETSNDGFLLAEDNYAFLDGMWYMEGNQNSATLEFVNQGDSSVWESKDENGNAVAAGRFTIVEGNEVKLYDAAGEYQLSVIAKDKNTLTMGDSGTAYIRDTTLTENSGSKGQTDDMEPQQIEPSATSSRTYTDNGDGTTTYKDFDLGIMFSYPTSYITVAEHAISDAATAGDETSGCFTVRDMTDWYYAYSGSNEACILDYVAGYSASDYTTLYGGTPEILDFKTVNVDKDTRIATASANLYTEGADIEIYCFIFNQTYSNGDNRILVGTYFANYGDTDEMNFLKNSFSGIGACRRNAG